MGRESSSCEAVSLPIATDTNRKKMSKTLHLTLSKLPFEVMVTDEKSIEFRVASDWIKSRLIGKEYDYIKFVNGYGNDKPYFVAVYGGWCYAKRNFKNRYSNGLTVDVNKGMIMISVGEIIEKGNMRP